MFDKLFGRKAKPVILATNLPTPVPPSAIVVAEPSVRIPAVGNHVWWAPKELDCIVTSVGKLGFTFQGGEMIQRGNRLVPRWTVATGFDHPFDESTGTWIIGEGRTPKNVRGKVILPDPVKVSSGSIRASVR